jgi:putative membrane protein insertion efficiency factor
MKRALLILIRFYQRAISPGLPSACRYQPTCSRYAYEAIERYGALRGSWLAARRLVRCVPWHAGGLDPVPVRERAPGPGPAPKGKQPG